MSAPRVLDYWNYEGDTFRLVKYEVATGDGLSLEYYKGDHGEWFTSSEPDLDTPAVVTRLAEVAEERRGKVLVDREVLRRLLNAHEGNWCDWPDCDFYAAFYDPQGVRRPHSGTCPLMEEP